MGARRWVNGAQAGSDVERQREGRSAERERTAALQTVTARRNRTKHSSREFIHRCIEGDRLTATTMSHEMNDGDDAYFSLPPSKRSTKQIFLFGSNDEAWAFVDRGFQSVNVFVRAHARRFAALVPSCHHLGRLC